MKKKVAKRSAANKPHKKRPSNQEPLHEKIEHWDKLFRETGKAERIANFCQISRESRELSKVYGEGQVIACLRVVAGEHKTARRLWKLNSLPKGMLTQAKNHAAKLVKEDAKQAGSSGRRSIFSAIHLLEFVGIPDSLEDKRQKLFSDCLEKCWSRRRLQQEINTMYANNPGESASQGRRAVVRPLQRARAVCTHAEAMKAALEDVLDDKFVTSVSRTKASDRNAAIEQFGQAIGLLESIRNQTKRAIRNLGKASKALEE
ncbi:hypothetical protein [Novipirellula artificiosorum]|uniref:Uncharacterized protein n=1 Tax=Novipirellula artificiosorum TaxID=2528016 RepID=A0A5C6CWJ9_9BACT|nr:hypothetical protein [Novipirellula artificiosorum]TWU27917.1 hypothetical protein Poly41_70360 [Novipirellula artificiosorum]